VNIQQIMDYLKTQPENAVEWTDSPYMKFAAEWQDWSFAKPNYSQLFLGYWFEQNGDLCPDPNYVFEFDGKKIVAISTQNLFGSMPVDEDDRPFALAFVKLVWDRHFSRRLAEVQPTGHCGSESPELEPEADDEQAALKRLVAGRKQYYHVFKTLPDGELVLLASRATATTIISARSKLERKHPAIALRICDSDGVVLMQVRIDGKADLLPDCDMIDEAPSKPQR
jgi:hypothetical protein